MQATMKAMAVALVLFVPASQTWAEDAETPPSPQAMLQALAEAGKPGAEHQKLQPFVGEWTFTMKVWTDPSQSPAELKGTIERKWIMDGRFVQEKVCGECATSGKSFEGMGLLGYDRGQKKYTSVKACSLCGTISTGHVTCDGSGRFTCDKEECCPVTGEKVKGRDEVVVESNDRMVMNAYRNVNGKEVKVMEIVSVRKK